MRFRITEVVRTEGRVEEVTSYERDEYLLNLLAVNIPRNLESIQLKMVGENYVQLILTRTGDTRELG